MIVGFIRLEIMWIFQTFEAAAAWVWALPFGIGKLMSIGGGGYLVCKIGQTFNKNDAQKAEDMP